MEPHVHMSPVHAIAMLALLIAVLGTIHLLALSHDTRASRAIVSLGF